MRVAVTGSQGFTGRHVTAALDRHGIDHVALDADISDPASIEAAVRDVEFDRVVHLAGAAFAAGADWRSFYSVNQVGTCNLLESIARHRPNARCILASSAQVYGPTATGLVDETHTCSPANHYAISKYAMELAARLFQNDLVVVIVRPFNYTGVGQQIRYVIPKIVDHFRRRAQRIELGNLYVKRDFGDVRSVAEAYCALVSIDAPPQVLNVGAGRLYSIQDVCGILSELCGYSPELSVNPAFVRPNEVPTLGADITLARQSLPGWSPRPLKDTLQWMLTASD